MKTIDAKPYPYPLPATPAVLIITEVCVQTTMREANDRDYECLLVEDATESYFPEFKTATLNMITAQGGIVGRMAPSDIVIPAIEKTYGH